MPKLESDTVVVSEVLVYAAAGGAGRRALEGYVTELGSPPDVRVGLLLDDRPGYALQVLPELKMPALVVTANRSAHYLLDLLEHEPEGLLVIPQLPPARVLDAYLAKVVAGERFYEGPPPSKSPLTLREREVLRHAAYGASTEALSYSLGITPYTAGEHLRHIKEKLNVERDAELVLAYFAGDAARLAV